jgi:hypothetical protein
MGVSLIDYVIASFSLVILSNAKNLVFRSGQTPLLPDDGSENLGFPHFQGQIGSGRLRRFTLNQLALAFPRRRRDEADQV